MRRFAMLLLLGLTLGAAPVWAVAQPAGAQPAPAQPAGAQPAAAQPAQPVPPSMRKPEILTTKPSGFWTSNRPAEGGAYRWRLVGVGLVLLAVTGYGMLRLVKRAAAERTSRVTERNARR